MLLYEDKVSGTRQQDAAIDEAIRIVQFIRNKSLRLWMETRGTSKNDLQCYCAVLAKAYPFASRLNSQARQAAASRAWFAISRFYDNCKNKKPGKKGYPKFQRNNRSVEYKQTGWNWMLMAGIFSSPMAVELGVSSWLAIPISASKNFP
ncbi:hypothetical protein KTH_51940 [Thermosporothrix hazakensis]|nr:hypothetical protein KTH_51940 [Thermosporothrix hazakensis]